MRSEEAAPACSCVAAPSSCRQSNLCLKAFIELLHASLSMLASLRHAFAIDLTRVRVHFRGRGLCFVNFSAEVSVWVVASRWTKCDARGGVVGLKRNVRPTKRDTGVENGAVRAENGQRTTGEGCSRSTGDGLAGKGVGERGGR